MCTHVCFYLFHLASLHGEWAIPMGIETADEFPVVAGIEFLSEVLFVCPTYRLGLGLQNTGLDIVSM